MANFATQGLISGQPEKVYSTRPMHPLGMRVLTDDGRMFRYIRSGGVPPLVPGQVLMGPIPNGDLVSGIALAEQVEIGSLTVPLVMPGTLNAVIDDNDYLGGMLWVIASPSQGYRIDGHKGGFRNSKIVFHLPIDDPIQTTLPIGTLIGLAYNQYEWAQQCAIAPTGPVVGVAVSPIPTQLFGWMQVRGLCPVRMVGASPAGTTVHPSNTVAGAAVAAGAGAVTNSRSLGVLVDASVDAKAAPVMLMLE